MLRSFRRVVVSLVLVVLAVAGETTAATLVGKVVDDAGRTLAGATVEMRAGAVTIRAATDDQGRFTLAVSEPSPPRLTLVISAPGHVPVTLTVTDLAAPLEVVLAVRPLFSGEVEVSGTRATVGETPVTVTNISSEQIERSYWAQDVPLLLQSVPAFYAYNDSGNGIGYSYFTVRGFDMRRTAVNLNGVPLNDASSHAVFFIDLADFLATTGDIQVQRGVGTGLYGGSAIGGSVDLRTRAPLAERRLRLSTLQGSWGTSRWAAEYDTGLVDDRWAATFRWSKVTSDGYRDQSWVEMWNYYAAIERYGERSTTRLILFGGPEETHLAYDGVPKAYLDGEISGDRRRDRRFNPLTYRRQIDEFFQPHYQLLNTWQLNDSLRLVSTVYYFSGDGFFEQLKHDRWLPEYDLEPFPGPDGELITTSDLVRKREVDEWDAGWIPYLELEHGSGRGALKAGAAIRIHAGRHRGTTIWAEHYPPATEPGHPYYDYRLGKQTYQPFVEETWRASERLTLLAGLTWTSHRYEMSKDRRQGRELSASFDYLLPRIGVTFHPRPEWSLFANVSRGGREPAFRDLYDPQDYWFGEPLDLDPEDLVDYELGVRHAWGTGYAQLNLYLLDFSNAIVFAGALDDNGLPVTANGAVLDVRGAELEVGWTPRPRWGARLALALSDASFDEFVEYGWDGVGVDQSGNAVAASPDLLSSLEVSGGWGPVDALLTVRHVGRFFLDNTEDERKHPDLHAEPGYINRVNDAFTTLDLALQADLGRRVARLAAARRVLLKLQVTNLTDQLYTTFGYFDGEQPVWTPAATRGVYAGLVFDW